MSWGIMKAKIAETFRKQNMSFQPIHLGLYFNQEQLTNARNKRDQNEALQAAWQWLLAKPGDLLREDKPQDGDDAPVEVRKPQLKGIYAAMNDALRYRIAEDETAGTSVVTLLTSGAGLRDSDTLLNTLMQAIATAHLHELVCDHPAFATGRDEWLAHFASFSQTLIDAHASEALDRYWQMLLRVVSGIVLEDDAAVQAGAAHFRKLIDEHVRPDGFIKSMTTAEDGANFQRHVLATAALVLTAEAATQSGVDLWSYESRDVGINTAVTYLVYYYFYPEKWRWDENHELTQDDTRKLFAQYGAWLEIATSRANPRGVELLLEEQRPLFSPYAGGLTTITHSVTVKRRRFNWLLGR